MRQMKANRKFKRDDDAVSPVIAVILMVAITVVLAATIYVWVSGFGASGSQSDTAALTVVSSSGGVVTLQLASVSPTATWNTLKIVVDGVSAGTYGIYMKAASCSSFIDSGTATAWDGTARLSSTKCAAGAGDIVRVGVSNTPSGTVQIRLVDTAANSVISQLTLSGLTGQSAVTTAVPTCVDGSGTITFAGTFYSKTGTDTAAIQASDLNRAPNAIGTLTHAAGATTATVTAAHAAGDTINAVASRLYTIAGAAVGTTASAACA